MPGFDPEDRQTDITGDPPPAKPLSKKQMQGAMAAQVHRTQLPAGGIPTATPGPSPSTNGQTEQKPDAEQHEAGQEAKPDVSPDVPILGGANQLGTTIQSEADAAIGLNPAHQQDWWRHALESPVESYYLGKHIYNAYYGAFLDASAVERSVHDIWHQDNAVGWMFRNALTYLPGPQDIPRLWGAKPEEGAAETAGFGLTAGADPSNILFAGPGGRGAALVAKFLAPGALAAVFQNRHTPSDLAWAILPAMIFGGKLPAPVAAQVEKVAPGAMRLFDKLSAVKLAQEESKTRQQQGQNLIQDILQRGGMGPAKEPIALQWEPGMKGLTKEQTNALQSSLMEKYGTLDVNKVIPALVRDGASTRMLRNVWTKLARMHYDLNYVAEGEGPMVDPLSHKATLPAAAVRKIEDSYQLTQHMVHAAYQEPIGHNADPIVGMIRSQLGHLRSDISTERLWIEHLKDIAGEQANNPREWDLFSRSIEPVGREAEVAYQSLSPEMKYVRDSVRLVAAAAGMAGEELGLLQRAHGYLPRVGLMVKDAGGRFRAHRPRVFTTEPRVHRTQTVRTVDLLTESRMQVEQAYKTTKEANDAVLRQRGYVRDAILNGTPWHDVVAETGAGIPEPDRKEIEQIQALIDNDPDAARAQAAAYAEKLLPEFSQNPFDALPKLGKQIRAVSSARAMQNMLNSVYKDGKALAVQTPTNSREVEKLMADGYKALRLPGFSRVMVHGEYAQMLEQMQHLHSAKPPGWLAKLLEVEGVAVQNIMFAPRIHGINMAGRLGIAMTRFGPDIREWLHAGMLQEGGGTSLPPTIPFVKGASEVSAEHYRIIPQLDGVIPPSPSHGLAGGGFAESYIQRLGDIFGDTEMGRVPLVRDMANSSTAQKASSGAKAVLGAVGKGGEFLWGKQSELWSWVSDFGNMMYWVELAAALRSGRFEDAARKAMEEAGTPYSEAAHRAQTRAMAGKFAAARANSWMGHVLPEDTNPWLHAALKSAFFAPNYWRSWGEILTGYYKKAGFGWSSDTIKYVVENEIKTAAAAVLFQQLSANALNLAFSGHSIYQNDPGNWGKVEITQPWAIAAYNRYIKATMPKDQQKDALLDEKTGRDARGRRLTWENPLGRQMTDTEGAMGFLTSSPHWTPQTFAEGFGPFIAARTSPVTQAISALGNIDLYRSISSGGFRYIDPNHDAFLGWDEQGPHPGTNLADLITAGGDLTPFSQIGQNIQQQVMQGNVDNVKVLGVPVPKAVVDAFTPAALGQDAAKAFLAGMTGVNPPHLRASRTQGVSPSDDEYKNVHEIQQKYTQSMTALSTASLSGQIPPYQWLATYRQLSAQHAAEMQAIFRHAPEYNNGPLGLTNSYENLYDQATDKNGVLQADKLRSLQQQWRAEHSDADYAAVRNELRVNDSKYPMLALYHKTQDAYYNWQADWAKENGVDLATLQSDMSGWSAVYNDRNASRAWLRDHPEITQFENAKKNEFEAGQSKYGEAGLMYALFFNPTAADRYLNVSGETAQQVEQAVQQEQVPAAP